MTLSTTQKDHKKYYAALIGALAYTATVVVGQWLASTQDVYEQMSHPVRTAKLGIFLLVLGVAWFGLWPWLIWRYGKPGWRRILPILLGSLVMIPVVLFSLVWLAFSTANFH